MSSSDSESAAGETTEAEKRQATFDIILRRVRENRPEKVRELITEVHESLNIIEQERDFNIYDQELLTRSSARGYLLHTSYSEAAGLGREECLRVFLEAGVPVDQTAVRERDTCLMIAARQGHPASVRLLLEHGANVNAHNTAHETAIFYAASTEIMQILYDNGADVNVENSKAETPLFYQVKIPDGRREEDGYLERLSWLLDHGVLLDHKDNDGATAIIHACQRGALRAVETLILAGARMDITDPTSRYVADDGLLSSAIFSKSLEMVKLVVSLVPAELLQKWKQDSRVLDAPIREHYNPSSLPMIRYFVEEGWSLTGNLEKVRFPGDRELYFIRHPLHHAASRNHPQVIDYFLELYKERSMSVDCDGFLTPLHQACLSKAPYCIERLLASGADLTTRDQRQGLPIIYTLDCSCMELRGHLLKCKIYDLGTSFRCMSLLLRHSDLYYLTIEDVSCMLLMTEDLLKFNHPVDEHNAPYICSAVLCYVTALYESCSAKYWIRGLLSRMKQIQTGDSQQGYQEHDIAHLDRWEYIMTPASLRLAARDRIRRILVSNIPEKIRQLPLPPFLRSYLNIPELDDLLEEYCSYDYEIHPLF